MDAFEVIVAGAVLVVMVLFGIALVYLILILRFIREIIKKMRSGGEAMQRMGEAIIGKVIGGMGRKRRKREEETN